MAVSKRTAILVVGMHRSGTSALAGLLGKLGIPLGDDLLEPGRDNPKGYWEHRALVSVHERLLSGLGSRWDDVRALPDNWLDSPVARLAAAEIRDIVSAEFSEEPVWAVKDPRLCRVLPLWIGVLHQLQIRPVVLFMVRRPSEVAASIAARNHWRPLVGKLLWLRYMTEALVASAEVPRAVVSYDDLLADPISSVTTALATLEVSPGGQLQRQERELIAGFVDIGERHHADPAPAGPVTAYDSLSSKLYDSLMSVAHGANPWEIVEQTITTFDREWSESGACVDAMADMAAQLETDLQAATIENHKVNSALIAQIRWSEGAQANVEALRAENEKAIGERDQVATERDKIAAERDQVAGERDKIAAELERTRARELTADAYLHKIHASMSWKLTKPLRSASKLFKRKTGPTGSSTRKPE